jgi:hypothetical protein
VRQLHRDQAVHGDVLLGGLEHEAAVKRLRDPDLELAAVLSLREGLRDLLSPASTAERSCFTW